MYASWRLPVEHGGLPIHVALSVTCSQLNTLTPCHVAQEIAQERAHELLGLTLKSWIKDKIFNDIQLSDTAAPLDRVSKNNQKYQIKIREPLFLCYFTVKTRQGRLYV